MGIKIGSFGNFKCLWPNPFTKTFEHPLFGHLRSARQQHTPPWRSPPWPLPLRLPVPEAVPLASGCPSAPPAPPLCPTGSSLQWLLNWSPIISAYLRPGSPKIPHHSISSPADHFSIGPGSLWRCPPSPAWSPSMSLSPKCSLAWFARAVWCSNLSLQCTRWPPPDPWYGNR